MKLGPIQRKWVASLKRNPHRQMTGQLGMKEGRSYKACCLGELGLIAGTCRFDRRGILREKGGPMGALQYSYKKLGLKSDVGTIDNVEIGFGTLALLNDTGHTWTEIAYYIEACPELFFTKSV